MQYNYLRSHSQSPLLQHLQKELQELTMFLEQRRNFIQTAHENAKAEMDKQQAAEREAVNKVLWIKYMSLGLIYKLTP